MTELESAAAAIGEPVDAGLWLQRKPSRWWDCFSTGSELDLIFVVLLLPIILWQYLFRNQRERQQIGPIYLALTSNQLIFFAATEGIFKRGLKNIYDRRDLDDVDVYMMNGKKLQIAFSDSDRLILHFEGPQSELEAFVSKAT